MDKRWFLILIIIIVGAVCMYFIVDSSPTVGKAVTVADEMTITLPTGFNLLKNDDKNVILIDHQNHTAHIRIIGLGNTTLKEYNAKLDSLKNDSEMEIQEHGKNGTGYIIFYKNITSNKEYSMTYFFKDNRTVSLKMGTYDNWQKDWKFIIDTIVHNFKQNKD